MSTQLAPITQFKHTLENRKSTLSGMLPAGMSVDRFIATALSGIHNHAQSAQLLEAKTSTLFNAVQKACADGLNLDGKEATLVTFNSKAGRVVEYIPMVSGLVKLAMQSGEISKIATYIVRESDPFDYDPAADSIPAYKPDWKAKPSSRGAGVLAVAVISLNNGQSLVEIMHEEDILRIAETGRNGAQYSQKGGKHWEAWWKKTVLKRALKYAPKGNALESVIDNDAEFESEPLTPQTHEPQQQQQQFNPNDVIGGEQVIEGTATTVKNDDVPL